MTVFENVELPLRLAEVPRGDRPPRVQEALERVGLAARVKHRPGELSGGEQQRVAIARALVNRPHVLLADEPTGNLDSRTGDEIMRLIAGINRPADGKPSTTVVMVTHERHLAEQHANRIITLADGRIAHEEKR
jgi:putative ABC transport system ATP-binding protein